MNDELCERCGKPSSSGSHAKGKALGGHQHWFVPPVREKDEPMTLDALWGEMLMDALASDGRISDADVKNALSRYRPRIEALAVDQERDKINAMRLDHRTLPHRQFYAKWPDHRDYYEVLPSQCSCKDCQLWRSGS